MIQVRLQPRGSHWHLVPVVVLYLLVIAVGDIKGMVKEIDWLTAAAGISIAVIMGIVAYYAVVPFLYMIKLKESWLGTTFFRLPVSPTKLRRGIVFAGLCLTYFGFVCRIWMIAGVEAAFLVFLLMAAKCGSVNVADPPSWTPYAFVPLLILAATLHTVVERRNLGMAGLSIVADRNGGWL